MDVLDAIYQRRSVRQFKPDPVPIGIINAPIAAAIHAPSAINLQPWAFIVIGGRDVLARYAERTKRHLVGTLGPDSLLFRYRDRLSDPAFDIFYGAPAVIVVTATSDAARSAEDCCMAAQNLLLVAYRLGLGTCCIGFARPWLNLRQTKRELGIADANVPVVPIAAGYASGIAARVPRKPPEILRIGSDA